jgi:hypothetical protein
VFILFFLRRFCLYIYNWNAQPLNLFFMKAYPSLAILMLAIIIVCGPNCKKDPSPGSMSSNDAVLIESARKYFQENTSLMAPASTGNPRLEGVKNPDWGSAYCVGLSGGRAVVVPVFYQQNLVVTSNFSGSQILPLNQLTKLVVFRDSLGYKMEVVTGFPDSTMRGLNSGNFSGIAFVETWEGQAVSTYKYSGKGILKLQAGAGSQTSVAKTVIGDAAKTPETVISTCYEISGYNYSPDDPDGGVYWTEPAGCDYEYVPGGGGGGGLSGVGVGSIVGGAGGGSATPEIEIAGGNNIIANVADYMQCFSNYGGSDHTYQVTICVSQPVPGSRTPWTTSAGGSSGSSSGGNPVNSGHTFLILSEIFSDHTIARNIGFYPQSLITPWSPSTQGQLNNDANHSYNISLTVTVDNGQFFNILNYESQGNNPGYMYNLSTNNCTSFDLHALDAGGVVLPATNGSWPGGGFGYDPGDLGEDIRNMQLSPNMTRSTVYNAHPNLYTCN